MAGVVLLADQSIMIVTFLFRSHLSCWQLVRIIPDVFALESLRIVRGVIHLKLQRELLFREVFVPAEGQGVL